MRLPPQQARHALRFRRLRPVLLGFWAENGRWAPPDGTPIERRDRAPSYSVISWIRLVSSGFGGPLWSAIALVMSPWSLIFPAMKACIAACGLASTIIALAVS